MEHTKIDEEALKRSASLLEQKLADFGVEGKVVEVQPGPVVTMYKFEPASGVKVSQIVNLSDDLSMALKALAIRIQAPVPGEAVVGSKCPTASARRFICARFWNRRNLPRRKATLQSRWARISRESRWWPTWRGCRIC